MARHTLTRRWIPKGHLLQKGLGFGILLGCLVGLFDFTVPTLCLFLARLASILVARSRGFDLGTVDVARDADVVGLFHKEKQEHKNSREEDGGPVENPLPALVLGDEAADDGREVVASCEGEGVDADISATLVGEVLIASVIFEAL